MSAQALTRGAGIRARAVGAALPALAAAATSVLFASPAQVADTVSYRATVLEHRYDTAKVVTLSFDADWSDAGVASVLTTLRANGITAAFSLTGRFVERYPASTRTIMAAGSKLVNHSSDHPYFSKLTQAQRWSELNRAEAAYNKLGYSSNGWFRAPYRDGYAAPGVNRDLALDGYYVSFDWTFDTTGYNGASTATTRSRARQYVRPGAIIVMHPGEGSTDPAALPQVISTLNSMGYGFSKFLPGQVGARRRLGHLPAPAGRESGPVRAHRPRRAPGVPVLPAVLAVRTPRRPQTPRGAPAVLCVVWCAA